MPEDHHVHSTTLFELRATTSEAYHLVVGVTLHAEGQYQTHIKHIWDLFGRDLTAGQEEMKLVTAHWQSATAANAEAAAIAQEIVTHPFEGAHQLGAKGSERRNWVALAAAHKVLSAPVISLGRNDNRRSFSDDLLVGCAELATFIYAADTAKTRRACYYLVEKSRLPSARLKSRIVSRKSWIEVWLDEQLRRGGFSGPANDNGGEV